MQHYANWYGTAGDLDADRVLLDTGRPPGRTVATDLFGQPALVVEQLRTAEAAGATAALWFGTFPGAAPAATLPLFETLAAEVMPAVR
jgi:hypothetical protein